MSAPSSPLARPLLALCLPALLAPLAGADDYLYLVGQTGLIERGDPIVGNLETLPVCVGSADDLKVHGDDLFSAGFGFVFRVNETSGQIEESLQVANDATALTVDGAYLYVGGSDGSVLKIERGSQTQVASFQTGVPVTAMVQVGQDLYAGSDFGIVMKADAALGDFTFWGTCGGPVASMATSDTHMFLVDTSGVVYRLGLASELFEGSFPTGTDGSAALFHQGALLVADSSGHVERVDALSGAPLGGFEAVFDVRAMALGDGSEVGTVFCYGQSGCPCGNATFVTGCRNSTGTGAALEVSGSASVGADDLALHASFLPPNQWGRFYMGPQGNHAPFGDGLLCAGSGGYGLFRFPIQNSGPAGAMTEGPGIAQFSLDEFTPLGHIAAGQSWYFQLWYRDPLGPCGSGFNTSSAAAVSFTP